MAELLPGTEAYDSYVQKAAEKLNTKSESLAFAHAFDISLIDPESGEHCQPTKPVAVSIQLYNEDIQEGDKIDVVHFPDSYSKNPSEMRGTYTENPSEGEILAFNVNREAVEFESDSFSVYVVAKVILEGVITASDGRTYKVTVSYDEDAGLPLDAALEVTELSGEAYEAYYALTLEALEEASLDFARIFDISIVGEDGTHYQPNRAVSVRVELIGGAEPTETLSVVHFGEETEILESVKEGSTVSFETDGFSVYAIGGNHIHTYRFFTYNNSTDLQYVEYEIYTDSGNATYTQAIHSGQDLVAPQLPALSKKEGSDADVNTGMTFSGWYIAEGVTESEGVFTYTSISDTAFDFNNIPEINDTRTIYLFAKFSNYAYVIFHDQYNGLTSTFPVAQTRRGIVDPDTGKATVRISDVSVSYDDDSQTGENTAPSMVFFGWSRTPYETAGQGVGDVITEESVIIDSATESKVNLYPVFQPIFWLTYYSGPTGSGATYIPSNYYYLNEGPEHLSLPVRSGYVFEGWYTGSVDSSDVVTYGTKVAEVVEENREEVVRLIDRAADDDKGVSVSGDKLRITKNAQLFAKWTEAAVNYSIVVWRQSANDAYGIADSAKTYDYETSVLLTDTVGATVSVPASYTQYAGNEVGGTSYIGFVYNAANSDTSKTIAADGSTVLNVRYDRVGYTFKMLIARSNYAGNGSFYLPNEVSEANRRAGWQTAVTNTSYNSAGNGVTSIAEICTYPLRAPGSSTEGYGVWYDTFNNNYRYYYYYIEANYGASIVDLWPVYKRNDSEYFVDGVNNYSLNSWKLMPTALAWGGSGSGTDTVKGLISVMDNQILGEPSNPNSNFMIARFHNSFNTWTYNLYFPALPGVQYDSTVTYNGTEYYLEKSVQARSGTNNTTLGTQHAPAYIGFEDPTGVKHDGEWVIDYYYGRKSYNLEFWDPYTHQMVYLGGTQQTAISVPYGAAVESYVIGEPTPKKIVNVNGTLTAQNRDGYNFTNWYADEACTTRVFFHELSASELSSMENWVKDSGTGEYYWDGTYKPYVVYDKMPDMPVKVYAGWETLWYLIEIDPNYGELNGTGATWFWESYGGDPIEEYTHVTRNYVESSSGEYYYVKHDRKYNGYTDNGYYSDEGSKNRDVYYTTDLSQATELKRFKRSDNAYRYAGWYEVMDDGTERLYSFGDPVTRDTKLILHWKKIGTYYVEYNPVVEQNGEILRGTLDSGDNNEPIFVELDGDDYADNADVVVTRTANAPDGYNFIGWRIRGDSSGKVYSPGETYVLLSKYTAVVTSASGDPREVIYMDAVYTRITSARIVYDANGGVIDPDTVDYGGPTDASLAVSVHTAADVDAGTATISKLVNNTNVILSDGTGFSIPGNGRLVGWCTEPNYDPQTDTLFELGGEYKVDTEEPVTLYAVWQVNVYFNLNAEPEEATFGGTWDSAVYTKVSDTIYSRTLYINNAVSKPDIDPVYVADPNPDNKMFHYWTQTRYTGEGVAPEPYDFSTPVTGDLYLYCYWNGPIQIPIHAVDASAADLAEFPSWLTQPHIEVGSDTVNLANASGYTNVDLSQYAYAFAAVKNPVTGLDDLSENNAITSLYYNTGAQKVYLNYADGSSGPLADEDDIYFVFYKKKPLNIGYKLVNADGSLTEKKENTATDALGEYDMQGAITTPLQTVGYANNSTTYFAYAIGTPNATNSGAIQVITATSKNQSSRPAFRVRNTWRGFQYTLDGTNWINCGYANALQLYVLYFESQPSVVTVTEKTVGPAADMSEAFEYNYVISEKSTVTTTVQRQKKTGNNWSNDGTPTTSTSETTTDVYDTEGAPNNPVMLADGESKTVTLFYRQTSNPTNGTEYNGWNRQTYRDVTTVVTIINQTVTVTQSTKTGYTTDNSSTGGTKASAIEWSFTTTDTPQTPTVTYTNTRTPLAVEAHVALLASDGTVTLDDNERTATAADYKWSLDLGAAVTLPRTGIFTGDSTQYGLAGIVYGSSADAQGSVVTLKGTGVASVAYEQPAAAAENIREMILRDADGAQIAQLGTDKIYYLYYKLPKVVYVKETSGGVLTPIIGDGEQLYYNGARPLSLNGVNVTQGQLLSVSDALFTITQESVSGSSGNIFNMPPALDELVNGVLDPLALSYSKLGVGPANTTSTAALDAVSHNRTIYLQVIDGILKWSLNRVEWAPFTGAPAVYAIYKEKGHDLRLTKQLVDDSSANDDKEFTVTISSPAIMETSYEVTGTGINTVSATPADGSTPGTIRLTMHKGSDITVFGLGRGVYTVTETDNANYVLSAALSTVGSGESPAALSVTDNKTLAAFTLNANKKLDLTNTRYRLTVEKYIYTDGGYGAATLVDSGVYTFPDDQPDDVPVLVNDILSAVGFSTEGFTDSGSGIYYAYDTAAFGEMRNTYAIYTDGRFMVYVRQDNGALDQVDAVVKQGDTWVPLKRTGETLKVYYYRTSNLIPILVQKVWDAPQAQIDENNGTEIEFTVKNGGTAVNLYTDSRSATGTPKQKLLSTDTAIIGNTDSETPWAKLLYIQNEAGSYTISEDTAPTETAAGVWVTTPSVKDVDNGGSLSDGVWVQVENVNLENAYIKLPCVQTRDEYQQVYTFILYIESVDGYCFRMEVNMNNEVNFQADNTYYIPIKLPKGVPYCALILPQSNGHYTLPSVISQYQSGETFYGIKTISTEGGSRQPRYTEYGIYDDGQPNSTGGPIVFKDVEFVHTPGSGEVVNPASVTTTTRVFARKRFTMTNSFQAYAPVTIQKVWADGQTHTDDSVTVQLRAGDWNAAHSSIVWEDSATTPLNESGPDIVLNAANNWTATVRVMPDRCYVLDETKVNNTALASSDYTVTYSQRQITDLPVDGASVTVTNIPKTHLNPIVAQKVWDEETIPTAVREANPSVSVTVNNGDTQESLGVTASLTADTKTVIGGTETPWSKLLYLTDSVSNYELTEAPLAAVSPGAWTTVAASPTINQWVAVPNADTQTVYLQIRQCTTRSEARYTNVNKLVLCFTDGEDHRYESTVAFAAPVSFGEEVNRTYYVQIAVPKDTGLGSIHLLENTGDMANWGVQLVNTASDIGKPWFDNVGMNYLRSAYYDQIEILPELPTGVSARTGTASLRVFTPKKLTITNTYTRQFTVTKNWVDVPAADQANLETDITLYKVTKGSGTEPITITPYVTEEQAAGTKAALEAAGYTVEQVGEAYAIKKEGDNWTHTFTGLPYAAEYYAVETAVRDTSTNPATAVTKYVASYAYDQAACTLTVTNGDYIARVSNDGGTTWTYHRYLINSDYQPGSTTVKEGAFDYANTLTGDVIIETLKKGKVGDTDDTKYEGDTVGRYTLGSGVNFNGESLTSVTLRTTQDTRWNPDGTDHFRSTLIRGSGNTVSMFIVSANKSLTTQAIILDGGRTASTPVNCTGDGGLVKVSSGTLNIQPNATLQNSKAVNGGAVYAANGATVSMTGGTINGNTATTAGAGIYLEQGSHLNLSGAPNFGGTDRVTQEELDAGTVTGKAVGDLKGTDGNFISVTSSTAETNGGKVYPTEGTNYLVREDIFIAGTTETLSSINVTGAITSGDGSIWVWAGDVSHYDMLKQFAVLDSSLTTINAGSETVIDTTKITETQLESTMRAFRNAQPDSLTNCGGDYLTGQKGEVITNIYWTGGFDVIFKKVDGFGNPLAGATFTLYTDEACTTAFQMTFVGSTPATEDGKRATTTSSDGTKTYKDKTGNVVTLLEGEVLLSKVAPKTYYMKETQAPTGYVVDTTLYQVTVDGTGGLTIKKVEGTDATNYPEAFKVQTKAAVPATDTAPAEPAEYQYHLMNTSSIERKVILRKVAENTYASLAGAKFRIFRADLTEVTEDRLAAGYYQSESSGVYFIGKLPLGKYYLVETGAPTDTAYAGNVGKVFILSVTSDGTMQKELGKTVTGDPSSNGTLLTQTTGSTESVKIFAAEGTKDLITVFKEWIMANPPTSSGGTDPSGTP